MNKEQKAASGVQPPVFIDPDKRVIVTNIFLGICHMSVCAVADATDEEILFVCNLENPAGTRNGWSEVIRDGMENHPKENYPVCCSDVEGRVHFLIVC